MKTITANERRSLAEQVGINEQYLYQCLTGRRDMSATEAVRLEQETNGRLDRKMLCRGSWRSIWPELLKNKSPMPPDVK
jgi:DNA-binding transcriptional regulator YdaS (Cro superfamily)